MTVSTTTNRWAYTGDAATVAFAYGNRIFASTDLKVYVAAVLQTSGYSVSGVGEASGGNVTFTTAPAAAAEVVIVRDVPVTQAVAFKNNDGFPAGTANDALDRGVILSQQLGDKLNRTLRLPLSAAALTMPEMPAAAATGDGYLYLTDGTPSLVAGNADVPVSAAMEAVVAAATVAAALTLLGLTPSANGKSLIEAATYATMKALLDLENTAKTTVVQTFAVAQRGAYLAFTDAATITLDLGYQNHNGVLGGNRTLGVPSNIVAGQSGQIDILQDATGSRTLAYAWVWNFAGGTAPVLTTPGCSFDSLFYATNYYSTATVTITNATPGVVTHTAHGLQTGNRLQLTTTGTLPTGLTASTTYWVIKIGADSYWLATTLANAAAGTKIATSSAGSGVHTAVACQITVGPVKGIA